MARQTVSVLLLSLLVFSYGCATTGYERAARTRREIDRARAATMSAQHEAYAAGRALQNLNSQETTDLRPAYQNYSGAVNDLSIQVDKLTNYSAEVQKLGNTYVEVWEKQLPTYQRSEIRSVSTERRAQVIESFQKLNAQFRAAQQSLRTLLVDLNDMRRYLSTDLTASGVASAREQSDRIVTRAAEAHQQLQSLVAELNRVDAELSPIRPAKQESAATK